ncbi:hypothetical protein [Neorhizobium sp. JUb45]|uniref:hypothetical protein n=1 Tax=unclassified Neorhizobium TaxID=2629175 RepID=UPI0010504527|nr:hypothetical protein [Neorhizobium sp. JUb45]TCR06783.1 hypothetical protein EDF70_101744 [Neorhizobium sp. JUb45]
MTKLEQIEKSVSELNSEELEAFSAWFEAFQAAQWDRRIENDSAGGKLDRLAEGALAEFRAGRTRPL